MSSGIEANAADRSRHTADNESSALAPEGTLLSGRLAESGEHNQDSRRRRVAKRLGRIGAGSLLVLGGAAGGAVSGLFHPVHTEITNGLDTTTELQLGDRTDISILGPALTAHSHELSQHLPIIGEVSPRITPNKINLDNPGDLAAAANNLPDIGQSIATEIEHNTIEGGAAGAGAVIGAGALMALIERNRKDSKGHHLNRYGAMAVTAGMLATGGYLQMENTDPYQSSVVEKHLDPGLIDTIPDAYKPFLEDMTLSGSGGKIVNYATKMILNYVEGVDTYWHDNIAESAANQFDTLRKEDKFPWEKDPNKTTMLVMSDVHGSIPFMENLPTIIKKSHANMVVVTGDQMSVGDNKSIIDSESLPMLLDSVKSISVDGQPVQIAFVSGNHDPLKLPANILNTTYTDANGDKYHPLIAIDKSNDYHIELNGLSLVGGPDENRTTTGDTVPASPADQDQNSLGLGHKLASTACSIEQETGIPPVVLGHEPLAVEEGLECASLTISGHLHTIHPVEAEEGVNNTYGYQQILGSASGDGPNNPTAIYNKPTVEGQMMLNVFDKTTGLLTDYVDIRYQPHRNAELTLHHVNGDHQSVETPAGQTYTKRYTVMTNDKVDRPGQAVSSLSVRGRT